MSEEKISHKELLTFSNLTNLEWEFVNLKAIKEGDEDALGEGIVGANVSTQLNDLLMPEVFAVRDEEGNIKRYIYGEDNNGNYEEQQGLIEMRKQAGIAMEYSEHTKEGEEGDFLKDWEVIYGGDKYKIVEDYLDKRWISVMKEHLKPEDFKLSALGLTEKDFKTS
ncbi:hypothetical protein [Halanaerobacter jeridensis]|uniref:Uncharacterized protein n=1 Tax=Halanaerobacter jeridensis TaxID=706427 RepID=A0A939BRU6_9FIRM|nr:hypothetical protein [Halanaerobacter jeridensis]MBM7556401.1 hypothetical protein [Halanaerobacter jeridensis]